MIKGENEFMTDVLFSPLYSLHAIRIVPFSGFPSLLFTLPKKLIDLIFVPADKPRISFG